jgi:hypothetical protein
MRNSFLATAVLGATVLSASSFAQVTSTAVDAYPYNMSIKGGVFFPLDDNLRSVDNLFGMLGAEYVFPTQLIRGSETFAEFDWIFHTTASSSVNVFPLTLNQRFWSQPGKGLFGTGRTYFFVGAGVTWIEPKGQAKLTFHGGLGAELGARTFIETSLYIGEQDSNLLRNSGIGVNVGYRF